MAWYFYHSYKGRAEVSVMAMEAAFGHNTGYALVYKTLECMGELGGIIPKSQTNLLSIMLGIDSDELRQFVGVAIEVGFFIDLGDAYGNEQFMADYEKINNKSTKSREAALQRWRQKDAEPEPELKPVKPRKPKPEPSQAPEQPLSTLAKVIKDEAQRLIDITDGSNVTRPTNRKCTLTASEYEKLAEYAKQSCGSVEAEKLARQLVREFYTWKFTADRAVKSDYLSMIKPWVLEKAQKHFNNPQRQPEPERSVPQQMTDFEKDQARDRTYRANRKMYDGRIGKSWEGLTEQEIENMIASRKYDESGKRIVSG